MFKNRPQPPRSIQPDPYRLLEQFRRRHPPQRLELDGAKWTYWDLGRGAQTLVFLHGMAGSGDVWFQQLLRFARHYRVVAPTYPPLEPLDRLVAGVWALLDHLDVDKAQFVGSSLGGLVVQYMASSHPERVERAVFSNTFPPGHPEIRRTRWLMPLARGLPTRVLFGLMKRSLRLNRAALEAGDRLLQAYLLDQYDGGMTRAQLLARAACVLGDFELEPPTMPHAIIESLDEPLLSRNVRSDLKRLYPRAWVHTFRKGGHFPYLTQAEEYNRVLMTFLDASYV